MSEKRERSSALRNFTRNLNLLNELFDDAAGNSLVTPQYNKVKSCWERLEQAHDEFMAKADETAMDIETDPMGYPYIDDASGKYNKMLKRYDAYLKWSDGVQRAEAEQKKKDDDEAEKESTKRREEDRKEREIQLRKAERKEKFDSAAAELALALDSFCRVNAHFDQSLANASILDKRSDWERVKLEFNQLKEQVIAVAGIDPSQDMTEINDKFTSETEKAFLEAKKWFMTALKDAVDKTVSSCSTSTKKEPVKLPTFEGAVKSTPFLKFPVWIERWEKLIVQYDEVWRSSILLDHLDDAACEKFVGYENNYNEAMERLKKFYGDPQKVVACVMEEVLTPMDIACGDYKGLLLYVDVLERNFNRLKSLSIEHEMSNTSTMSQILRKFPRSVSEKWVEHLSTLSTSVRTRPFPEFILWLISMRFTWEGMASLGSKAEPKSSSFYGSQPPSSSKVTCFRCGKEGHKQFNCTEQPENKRKPRSQPGVKKFWCALHKNDPTRHCWSISCEELRKMSDVEKRVQLLLENKDCQHCCGDHRSEDCKQKDRVCGGGKNDRGCTQSHKTHELFCAAAKVFSVQLVNSIDSDKDEDGVLLLIMQVKVARRMFASVFWDLGSTSNFIRERFAQACGFRGYEKTLSVITLGGVETEHLKVVLYKCRIMAVDGSVYHFEAYGMENITGALSVLNKDVVQKLFPRLDGKTIQNVMRATNVDILIGAKHPSWHPDRAEPALGQEGDLWLYRGRFGVCIGGRHPLIKEGTRRSDALFHVNHIYHVDTRSSNSNTSHELEFCANRVTKYKDKLQNLPKSGSLYEGTLEDNLEVNVEQKLHPAPQSAAHDLQGPGSGLQCSKPVCQCYVTKTKMMNNKEIFFELENLGVMIDPKCGGCKCSACPVLGSKYSFSEQKQFDIIQKNLFYDESLKRWVTEYPWKLPRNTLPRNYKVALQNLYAMEKRLSQDEELAQDFCDQIQSMIDRGAAVILSETEIAEWDGDHYYLALVGIKGKKKWLRICFDASRKQGGRYSMNDCLYKGPDRFMNNLLSVCLGFRNGRVAAAADLSKFHNQVRLVPEDVHMQRFLWRGMKTEEQPKTLAVIVNNFGVKPANCIATSALHKSADIFKKDYPEASRAIREQTYVDDELVAAESNDALHQKTAQMDEITAHAGMPNKGWTYSGDEVSADLQIGGEIGETGEEKVLGVLWNPQTDMFKFQCRLNLKVKTEQGLIDLTISSVEELDRYVQDFVLTRKLVLSNIMRVFDPMGLLSPCILQAKLLLRQTGNVENLAWDDPLPEKEKHDWLCFLKSLLELNEIAVPRSLWPDGEVEGLPLLVVFSDGSILAYGVAAYIRWEMKDGSYWSRLIMAKSKIAPKRIISVPRMELSGAVVGNRVKNFLLKETNLQFSRTINLVDSSTVLGYLHKESSNFGQFEGIKIAEVQSTNEFADGKLIAWGWVPGRDNPADWCTKPRTPQEILGNDIFLSGPAFLKTKEEDWPVRFTFRTDKLEGEAGDSQQVVCGYISAASPNIVGVLAVRCSSWVRIVRVIAWLLRLVPKERRSKGVLTCDEVNAAERFVVMEVQREINDELMEGQLGKGRFRKLAPVLCDDGLWRVGSRLRNFVPFTFDGKMPKIIPTQHPITLLLMRHSHQFSHAGLDGTLSRFYSKGYWTVRAGHIARGVKNQCVTCRKINKITIEQPLGEFTYDRLTKLYAWGYCQLDLFGPFSCRGDVNPRTTKKTWAVVIEDSNSGAVHLDIVQDYSTQAVLLTLRRFGALRGWPGVICSDPGSQLEAASGKLENWWFTMEKALRSLGSSRNFRWEVSPADSPWRQGKAERRIGVVKKLLTLSLGDTRVTPVELQTILFECANICNERPIGMSKPREDGSYSLITPNQLLLGRSINILPDDTKLADELPIVARYRLIQHVTTSFWNRWASEVSPGLVYRQKWHLKGRNLKLKDVVLICEKTKVKAKYRLAIVDQVKFSSDGNVRSATLRYTSIRTSPRGKDICQTVRVERSVQRLCVILPVEEQTSEVEVNDHEYFVQCNTVTEN